MFNEIAAIFKAQFGYSPECFSHAPGRVNIIGDHTDYNDGFVLPAAINFGTNIAIGKRRDRKIRVFAYDCSQMLIEFSLDTIEFNAKFTWVNYVAGSLKMLMRAGYLFSGADIAVSGNVPQGAGLSSSASFEIALLRAMASLYQLELSGIDAAKLGQQSENEFVGCNCGIMDQLISALGQCNQAMLLDCRSLDYQLASLPEGYSLFIVDSKVKRGLVESAYNDRRAECELVAKHFSVTALRDLTLAQLESEKANLSAVAYKRARHVITENDRTLAAFTALENKDMTQLATLMRQSHNSLQTDFETSTPEMNYLVKTINAFLGEQGGARMTGGGFGGCVVALVPIHLVEQVKNLVISEYTHVFGYSPEVHTCNAVNGAFSA